MQLQIQDHRERRTLLYCTYLERLCGIPITSRQSENTCCCRIIVELQPNSPAEAAEDICKALDAEGTSCSHIYYRVFKGFAADVRPTAILPALLDLAVVHLVMLLIVDIPQQMSCWRTA